MRKVEGCNKYREWAKHLRPHYKASIHRSYRSFVKRILRNGYSEDQPMHFGSL